MQTVPLLHIHDNKWTSFSHGSEMWTSHRPNVRLQRHLATETANVSYGGRCVSAAASACDVAAWSYVTNTAFYARSPSTYFFLLHCSKPQIKTDDNLIKINI